MKRTFALWISLFAVLFATSAFAQGQKVGFVDSDSVMVSIPEYNAQMKQYESYANQLRKQIQTKEQELQTKYQALIEEQDDLIPEIIQERQRELQQLQQNLEQFAQQSQQNLQRKEQQLMQPLLIRVQEAIDAVAEEKGFDYIVNKQVFLFSAPTNDLTGDVITKVKTTSGK